MEPDHAGCYILTHSLAGKVKTFNHAGLEVLPENDIFFEETTTKISRLIQEALPSAELIQFSLESLMTDIVQTSKNFGEILGEDYIIVSPCNEISEISYLPLEVNRIADHNGKDIDVIARHGTPDLDSQIHSIIVAAAKRKIILVEDGSFSGKTIIKLINDFRNHGREIDGIVLGLMTDEAETKIQMFSDKPILTCRTVNNIKDWLIEHDLLPWIPNAGRPVGYTDGKSQKVSLHQQNGMTFAIPYGLHYKSLEKFASIDHPVVSNQIIRFCIERSIKLFERMEAINNKEILISDVCGKLDSVAVPLVIGNRPSAPPPHIRILDHLYQIGEIVLD